MHRRPRLPPAPILTSLVAVVPPWSCPRLEAAAEVRAPALITPLQATPQVLDLRLISPPPRFAVLTPVEEAV